MTEQEVKLRFATVEAARQAVMATGSRLVVSRRMLDDRLFDFSDGRLRLMGVTLRVRRDADRAYMTLKGPVQPGPVKSREEWETLVGSAATVEAALGFAGFQVMFRSQKYREEYDLDGAHLAIDETPFGVFVEIEAGSPEAIEHVSARLGRTPADYSLVSYPTLWRQWREAQGLPPADMLFDKV